MLGLDAERVAVLQKDLFTLLPRRRELGAPVFGVVFVDPPYGKGFLQRSIKQLVQYGWTRPDGLVVAEVEASLHLDFTNIHPQLEIETDRRYGQSRILVWRTVEETTSQYTPEPSTP